MFQERTFVIDLNGLRRSRQQSQARILIWWFQLSYLDAIDSIFFEGNVNGNNSDVTVTVEESFAEQHKKKANKKIQPGSVKEKKKYVQNKQNKNMQTKGIKAVAL